MNATVRRIMQILKLDAATALRVYQEMQVDFSEAEQSEIDAEARRVAREMRVYKGSIACSMSPVVQDAMRRIGEKVPEADVSCAEAAVDPSTYARPLLNIMNDINNLSHDLNTAKISDSAVDAARDRAFSAISKGLGELSAAIKDAKQRFNNRPPVG